MMTFDTVEQIILFYWAEFYFLVSKHCPCFETITVEHTLKKLIQSLFDTRGSTLHPRNCDKDINDLYRDRHPLYLIAQSSASTDEETVYTLFDMGLDPFRRDSAGHDTFFVALMFMNIKYIEILVSYMKTRNLPKKVPEQHIVWELTCIIHELTAACGPGDEEDIREYVTSVYQLSDEDF